MLMIVYVKCLFSELDQSLIRENSILAVWAGSECAFVWTCFCPVHQKQVVSIKLLTQNAKTLLRWKVSNHEKTLQKIEETKGNNITQWN